MLYQLNYWRILKRLTGLFMNRMTTAPRAILLDLHTIRHVRLVLGGRIIATLALGAGKCNESTHVSETSKYRPTRARLPILASDILLCQCSAVFIGRPAKFVHIHLQFIEQTIKKPDTPKGTGLKDQSD